MPSYGSGPLKTQQRLNVLSEGSLAIREEKIKISAGGRGRKRLKLKGPRNFSSAFIKQFQDVIDPLSVNGHSPRWDKAPTPRVTDDGRFKVLSSLVGSTLHKYDLHPDRSFLKDIGQSAAIEYYTYSQRRGDAQIDVRRARNFIEYAIYHGILAGKGVRLNQLLNNFLKLPEQSLTDSILHERKLELQLFGGADDEQPLDTDREVQRFQDYIEYLADRYAFTGTDVTELIERGRYGASRAMLKFGIDGDSPEYRGLVLSHINWHMYQASKLSPEQRMQTPDIHQLIRGYREKKAYELRLAEEEEERQEAIHGKLTTFNRFVRKFLNQKEYRSIEDKITEARESIDEDSDPLMAAASLITENIPRYEGKNVWDFKFGGHWPEELKRQTLEKLRYVLEEERGIPEDQIPTVANAYLLKDLGFGYFLMDGYKGRVTDLVNDMYPGRFKPWEFRSSAGGVKGRGCLLYTSPSPRD